MPPHTHREDGAPVAPGRLPHHATGCPPIDHPEAGQAMIEFALVLPVLLLVVFGITAFGIAMSNYLMLEDATNVGARQLAISRGQTTDPCSTASSAISAAAPNLTRASLGYTFTLNGVAYSGTTCASGTNNMVQGATAKVVVTYPCSIVSFRYNFGACTLSSATAELIQ